MFDNFHRFDDLLKVLINWGVTTPRHTRTHTHLTHHHVDRGETQQLQQIILFKLNPYTVFCTTLLKVGFALTATGTIYTKQMKLF